MKKKSLFPSRQLTRQHGGAIAPLLLLIGAAVGITAYTTDGARMKSSAAQLKRATDSAAMAVAQAHARDNKVNVQEMAQRYIQANLGMDSTQTSNELNVRLEPVEANDAKGYRVHATFTARPTLLGGDYAPVTVSSAAVARYAPMEIALMQPVDLALSGGELDTLKQLSKDFVDRLFDNSNGAATYAQDKNLWVSLVPYSQSVNVFDAADPTRINRWARPGALRPVELTSLFRTGYTGLADGRMPDRVAKLLCVYRGLGAGQNFWWDVQPVSTFGIYYRHDLPINGSPGAAPISWVGPNPWFGQATGVNDTRSLVADRGCPNAALLPLSADRDEIFDRLDAMTVRFNVNYAIAMSWAGASLSPYMRGANGWGDKELPLDFNEDGSKSNQKVIVMVAKIAGDWMDTDSYNHELGESSGESNNNVWMFSRQRFLDLCRSFQERKLRFYFIGVQPGDPEDIANTNFGRQAMPGMTLCASNKGKLDFFNSTDLRSVSDNIAGRLGEIADEIKRDASFVRLIE